MSKGLNNPKAFSTQDEAEASPIITPVQIVDGGDFPHTGLIKALSLGMKGNYATTGFNATAVTDDDVTFADGVVFRDGEEVAVTGSTIVIGTTTGTTKSYTTGYHLVVNQTGTTTLTVRPPTGVDAVPAYTDGDVIIAILAYTSQDPMQIQYLTVNKSKNSLSVARSAGGTYTEMGTITADTDSLDIVTTNSNADINITPNGNGKIVLDGLNWPIADGSANQFLKTNGSNQLSFGTVDLAPLIAHTDIPDSDTGFVKRTGSETYDIDTNTYLTAETDTLQSVTNRSPVTTTDITCGSIISNVNQNISYEEVNASSPIITGTKSVAYIHDISATGNTVALPAPASGNILHIVNFHTNTVTITGNPLINKANTTHPKITAPNIITLEPFEHVTLQGVNDGTPNLQLGHMIISDGDKDRSSAYATAAQGAKADSAQQPPSEGAFVNGDKTKVDSALQTNTLVRYGLTSDKTLSSASRYTFTSGDFTAYAADTNAVTFSGENITLKGAGIFEVNLYGYFIADTANAQLEFDLSIGDGNQHNKYTYNRTIITLNTVVRFSQFTTATIKTTGDTVIKLSGYIVWSGANRKFLATGSSDPQSANNPQYTAFTIRKVA